MARASFGVILTKADRKEILTAMENHARFPYEETLPIRQGKST